MAYSVETDDSKLEGAEKDAKAILKGLGFSANKIARTSQKSADFAVNGDEPAYLVEVKSRLLDERLSKRSGPTSEPISKPMRHDPKVIDWLVQSKKQFKTLDPQHERLWFLWCSIESPLGGMNQVERTVSVLYGLQEMLDIEPPNRAVKVFYAMPSLFERFPEIDGAVIVLPEDDGLTFCPNEASPRFEGVMRSKLVRSLRDLGIRAMLPSERAAVIDGYVVPPHVRPGGQVAVLRHVQEATGLPYLTFMAIDQEYMQTGTISLSERDELEAPDGNRS